jgi:hypothetical protein
VSGHPVIVSAVILLALAFALSPYILLFGLALLLIYGVPALPPFLRPLIPAPLVQVCACHSLSARCQSCIACRLNAQLHACSTFP